VSRITTYEIFFASYIEGKKFFQNLVHMLLAIFFRTFSDSSKTKLMIILVEKPEGEGPLGRPRHRREHNIRMYLRKIRWEGVDWLHLAEDRDQWLCLVKTVMNIRVP
jgi:hypothetical protein